MATKVHIPKIPHAFFKWYCQRDLYEELHGDLEEFYYERVEEKGIKKAKLLYLSDVIRCCQPYAWKDTQSQNSNIIMFRNYYKTSIRSMMKNPLSSFINIFGLSTAIGICIFVYGFAQWTYSTDQFHENKEEVYLATFYSDRDGTLQQNGQTPRPLGEMLREDFTHIKKICRVEDQNVVIKYEDNVFHERIRFTDSDFLEMFTFPLKWGTASSLSDVNSIILSEKMSIKYFGQENPVGLDLSVKFNGNRDKTFKISGVAHEFPKSRTISFDFLINFENVSVSDPEYNLNDWGSFVNATLIQVDMPSDLLRIESGMEKYKALQNEAQSELNIDSFAFEQLATLHQRSGEIKGDISRSSGDNYTAIIFLVITGLSMLALACFNYINIAIVSATKRLKEIGIRKSIGATRRVVFIQFITENIFVTFFALVLGLILGVTVVIPWFEGVVGFNMGFSLMDMRLWLFLPLILLFTGVSSGLYPAIYISKFQVTGILKGAVEFGRKNPLTKLFLGFQLILACVVITFSVMFTQNSSYLTHRSWGYGQSQVLYAAVQNQSAFDQLEGVMAQDPNVLSISGSNHHLGKGSTSTIIDLPHRKYEVQQLSIDTNYFETMGLDLTEGRFFKPHHESDKQTVVINETMAKNISMKEPIGLTFKIDSFRYEVIGVVKDFHSYHFDTKVEPTFFKLAEPEDYQYLSIKVRTGAEQETYEKLQGNWASLFPEIPFPGGYQEDVWGSYFESIDAHGRVWRGFATIAVLLAGLGLYGLVKLNVEGRTKEFSIRRILGANLKSVATNIINQYIMLFTVAFLIGVPISYFLTEFVLDFTYEYHMPMNFEGVTLATILLIFILITVVFTQVGKLSKDSPVSGLRSE